MLKKSLILLATILLASCAVPVTQISGPNGQPAFVLKCSGYGRDRQDCLAKAGEICPAGYAVVDDNSQVNGAVVTRYNVIVAHKEYMTISCK